MNIKLPFGMKDGKIVHISEIPLENKGLKCECICPECKEKLIARLGNVRIHHFAHDSDKCEKALETALHYFAKEVLQKFKKINLPSLTLKSEEFAKYEHGLNYAINNSEELKVTSESVIEFDRVESEVFLDGIRPDIILYKDNVPLLIEIAVTHFIDEEKLKKIKRLKISTIEIKLCPDEVDFYNFDKEKVEKLIIESTNFKEWIYNRKAEKRKREISEKIKANNIILKKRYEEKLKADKRKHLARINRVKKLVAEKHSEKNLNALSSSVSENALWKTVSKYLEIKLDTIPDFLNIEVKGELSFDCDRRIWQSYIYSKFIEYRKHKSIKVISVINSLKKYSKLPLNKDLIYTKDITEFKVYDLTDAVYNYLSSLEKYGILRCISCNHKYYAEFKVLYDDINNLKGLSKEEIKNKITHDNEIVVRTNRKQDEYYEPKREEYYFQNMGEQHTTKKDEIAKTINSASTTISKRIKHPIYDKVGKCRICGKLTSDWITFNGVDNTCMCRECEYKNNNHVTK